MIIKWFTYLQSHLKYLLSGIFFCFYGRGPLCLLRFELGVLTNGRLGTVEMVSEYIKHDQAEEVLVNE